MNSEIPAFLLFINLLVFIREFFAVWDYIDDLKLRGRVPLAQDYFELFLNGILVSLNFLLLGTLCFRQ